ncbi:hypothetical protein [[Clostridium] polysaccharolyticum]|uniref:Uncharacterized protein n=1 Tax=[Clostridium] polysaccharolyticum TaxID=29364 RepID=A0A1I0AS75_9FIRM|nr:hypothetical protein [[Clostridium] polysaccharolyticum]SES97237.1 hypothetical protein SAMN04487772_10621 [[Clostridium] polysaccharolyticum]
MSWCPKCKQEFQDGITICPTCNEPLVDELDTTILLKQIDFFSEEEVNKFASFLTYSKLENISWEKDEASGNYYIRCQEEDVKEIAKLFGAFMSVEEDKKEAEETENYEETDEEPDSSSRTYVKKQDQYSDVKSTGIMLIGIGIVGLAYVVLNATGILHLLNGTISFGLNIALFAAAFLYGIYSMRQAKVLKGEIAEEETVRKKIMNWINEHVTDEFLENCNDPSLPDEANYLKQYQEAKQLVQKQYPDVKENFIESLLDEKMN